MTYCYAVESGCNEDVLNAEIILQNQPQFNF